MKNAKHKLFQNKKGFNDMVILSIISCILIISSIFVASVNAEFNTNLDNANIDNIKDDLQDEASSITTISAFGILATFFQLIFWDIGNSLGLPIWLDAVFTILFIIGSLVVARNIWVGGGS